MLRYFGEDLIMKAFPNGVTVIGESGMDLRDWFAGQALTGLLASPDAHLNAGTDKVAAENAYQIADAMMEARKA